MKKMAVLIGLFLLTLSVWGNSFADLKSYVWTYDYQTMLKGRWEAENYLTFKMPDYKQSDINTIQEWVELEYGLTERLDVAMYQMYKFNNKANESDSGYEGFKIRSRYRFGEKNKFILDPMLYMEYIYDPKLKQPNTGEVKLILAKDIGGFNLSYNQIVKRSLAGEGKVNNEYAAGLSYGLLPSLKLGIEGKGGYNERKNSIGPTLSWRSKRLKLYCNLGAVFGINRRTDDLQVRMIVGKLF